MRAAVLLSVLAVSAAAQPADPATGRIAGVVTDAETGEPLIAVNVWLVGTSLGAATDLDGRFAFEAPVGEHRVRVSYVGYDPQDVPVAVGAGETTTLNAELEPGELVVCDFCTERPLLARGVYTARVVVQRPDGRFCTPLRRGDSYVVSR